MKYQTICLTEDELRRVGRWAANCTERVLPLFAAKRPSDTRPQAAVDGIRVYVRGGKRTARLRTLALAAHAAARDVDDPALKAVARSAGLAAAVAYTHALASADQARHILGPAVYAVLARELAGDVRAGEKEMRWAIRHASPTVRKVVKRFPPQPSGRSRLALLYSRLDANLRGVITRNSAGRNGDNTY